MSHFIKSNAKKWVVKCVKNFLNFNVNKMTIFFQISIVKNGGNIFQVVLNLNFLKYKKYFLQ